MLIKKNQKKFHKKKHSYQKSPPKIPVDITPQGGPASVHTYIEASKFRPRAHREINE